MMMYLSIESLAYPPNQCHRIYRLKPNAAFARQCHCPRFCLCDKKRDTLDQLLLANEAKAARERLTLIRLFGELRGRGYDRGYDAMRRYARRWTKEHGAVIAAVYVPLSLASVKPTSSTGVHEVVLLSGVTVTVVEAVLANEDRQASVCFAGRVSCPKPLASSEVRPFEPWC